jgi:secreted PhoX family phosphatase
VPKKRTAMGRFKHEGAACRITNSGRVACYSGDDARFEYVYKFVSSGSYSMYNRSANKQLLDEGILYVARFDAGDVEGDEMGSGVWLPLVWEEGNALDQAGYSSQAEVLLDTRGAADVLGATPMDRPEDIEVSPDSGWVYIALTNNSRRDRISGAIEGETGGPEMRMINGRMVSAAPNEANPRNDTWDNGNPDDLTGNEHGHIIELIETGNNADARPSPGTSSSSAVTRRLHTTAPVSAMSPIRLQRVSARSRTRTISFTTTTATSGSPPTACPSVPAPSASVRTTVCSRCR